MEYSQLTDLLSVCELHINIRNETYKIDMYKELEISIENGSFDKDLCNHSQKQHILSVLYEEAFESYRLLQHELKCTIAESWLYYKQSERNELGKVLSDTKVDMLIDKDLKIQDLRKDLIRLDTYCQHLKISLESFKTKERLLHTYCSNLRKTV